MNLTTLELMGVAGDPRVKVDLPILNVGDHVHLRFRLHRNHQGRREQLKVEGLFVVSEWCWDGDHQVLKVIALDSKPVWRSIKKARPSKINLAPTHTNYKV